MPEEGGREVARKAGVLALQGCIDPHVRMFERLDVDVVRVRIPSDLDSLHGIILPGGESTTMLRLLHRQELFEPLREFGKKKGVWGICAGAILIADRVVHPSQESLRLMPIEAHRNFYGCQLDSFSTELDFPSLKFSSRVDFIRAPLLKPLGPEVEVLASHGEQSVLLRSGNIMAASFHIELGDDTRLHRFFVEEVCAD